MSKGAIVDFRIRIKPSPKLIEFLKHLDVEIVPENVINLMKVHNPKKLEGAKLQVLLDTIKTEKLTSRQTEILKNIELKEEDFINLKDIFNQTEDGSGDESTGEKHELNRGRNENEDFFLELNDLRWLHKILAEKRSKGECEVYLHELLQGSDLILPENQIIPRNPELEARCQKLKEEQEAREYRDMTRNVDCVRKNMPADTVAYQIKAINRQLIAVLQFIFSVAAGFAFGFLGVQLIIGNLDFGFRLLLGIICSLTIALAEIYFLAKKLNEYDEIEVDSYHSHQSEKKEHVD